VQSKGWNQIDVVAEEIIRRTPFRKCELVGGVLAAECDALFGAPPSRYADEGGRS
jgi:tRNA(adenine34) deaminase